MGKRYKSAKIQVGDIIEVSYYNAMMQHEHVEVTYVSRATDCPSQFYKGIVCKTGMTAFVYPKWVVRIVKKANAPDPKLAPEVFATVTI